MKKELKDYLHLYLGCDCMLDNKEKGKLIGFDSRLHDSDIEMVCFTIWIDKENDWTVYNDNKDFSRIKPILRPLSDMTDDEMKELYLWVFKRPFVGDNITHRDIGKEQERKVLWSGCDRLFIYKDGDVGADCDLHHYPVHAPSIVLWQLSKHFDLFGLIPAGLAIDKTTVK